MKASVIIPAFNAEKTITACLNALQEQSQKPFEVIVVDDGSTDNTAEAVKRFKGIRLLQQSNAGPAAARNFGVKKALGEIIVFLDSDCVATKNWLEEMLAPFAGKEIVGVQGRYKTMQSKLIARFIQLEIEERYEKMMEYKYIDFIGSYAAAYKKSVFAEMQGFDTSFPMASGEDTDLSFRIHKAGYKMIFNPRAVVFHSHPESLAKYLKVKFFRALWRMKIYNKHKKKMVRDAYTSQTVKLQALLFYLLFGVIVLEPFFQGTINFALPLAVLLLLSTLKFALWAFARDRTVALASPFVIVLRTAMFDIGMLFGIANYLRGVL